MPFYQADDTGMATTIRKGSAITRQHDRIQFLQNHNALKYFSSQNLQSLSRRFESVLRRDLGARYDIGEAWRTFPDLYHFLQDLVGRSAIEALMGTKLLEMSPTLVEDFWIFEANSPKFLKLYPRLLNRKGYQARERLVSAVKQWHAFAHDSQPDLYAKTAPDDPDWEPVFGSKFLKVRQQYELQMPALDADARAREDVGLMFGVNANIIPAMFWFILEALKDTVLHSRMMSEVSASTSSNALDINKLASKPLLQSAYAEVLRLRVAVVSTRAAEYSQLHIGDGYTLPQHQRIIMYSRVSALNEEEWRRAGRHSPIPLTEFDAERFLLHPSAASLSKETQDTTPSKAEFSTEGLAGLWFPYGGGDRMCPGRHFAKQELLITFAILFSNFEIEPLETDLAEVEPDMSCAPFGTLPPLQSVPFRIRAKKK